MKADKIDFVDTTLRDAQASLWGEKMNTAMMVKAASMMSHAGFKAIDATAISHFEFAVRYHRENPWERMRILSSLIPNTPLSIMTGTKSLTLFKIVAGPILSLWFERLAANGIKRIQTMEPSNIMEDIAGGVRYAKSAGLEVVVALTYSLSPFHTDEYFSQKTRDIVRLSPDAIYLKDPGGLLTPERIRTLIPAIQGYLDGLPLELHSHCTTGLAPLCYLEAMKLGVKTFHTAIPPLANGSSQPSIENIIENASYLGYVSDVDNGAIRACASHFLNVARAEGLPIGAPLEYQVRQYDHQVPGGVISNLRRQLAELGLEDRLPEVLEEAAVVRKELGYPIMVTPFSQYVVTQAAINVTQEERYKAITDELIHFALGHWGKQDFTIDENLMDRINNYPRTKELVKWIPEELTIEDLRNQFGNCFTDDELLLLVLCNESDFMAMRNAGPVNTEYLYNDESDSIKYFISKMLEANKIKSIEVKQFDCHLSIKRDCNHPLK